VFPTRRFLSVLLVGAALAAGVTACGDSHSDELQHQGAKLQQQAQQASRDAQRAAEEVSQGTRSAEDAAAKAQADAEKLTADAKQATSDAIDTVKGDSRVPDDVVKQLEDAQQQIQQSAR
jgi:predicted  nucleic acid-binding Zn-ribbon protein